MEPRTRTVSTRCQRILACVADNDPSDQAVHAAIDLARRWDASLEIVHVVRPLPVALTVLGPDLAKSVNEDRRKTQLETLRERLARSFGTEAVGGVRVPDMLSVLMGSPPRALIEHARARAIDLICLGSSGKGTQLDLGGTARALLAEAPCPVWLQPRTWKPVRRILAPVDLSEFDLTVLGHVVEFAQRFEAKVLALHCFELGEFISAEEPNVIRLQPHRTLHELRDSTARQFEQLMSQVPWGDVQHEHQVVDDRPARRVLSMQADHDLIVIGTHGHTGLSAALLGSTAYSILRQASIPVLAFPA